MVATLEKISALEQCELNSYTDKNGAKYAGFYGVSLRSNFQPIYSLSHRRPIGYEGLLRIRDANNHPIPPLEAFSSVQSEPHVIELDRLSRYLHAQNFKRQIHDSSWLFLNVHPSVLMNGKSYGSYFDELLAHTGIDPSSVVVEILEESIADKGMLDETIQYYRDLGCLIAIDDFGTGNSNFDRVWKIQPDIVKLDKSIVRDMKDSRVVQRMLPNLVSLIHECGSLVLLEGIEYEEQALMAVDSGADFIQGFFLGKPSSKLINEEVFELEGEAGHNLRRLCSVYQSRASQKEKNTSKILDTYTQPFNSIATELAEGKPVDELMSGFLALSGIERCYILDKRGFQLGSNYLPEDHAEVYPQRFAVLEDQCNASWFRRPYFRRATSEPGKMHVSRPYLSMTAGIVVITMSIMVLNSDGKKIILCSDIDWTDR